MLYSAHIFISDHITTYNPYYLLSLHKTEVKAKLFWCTNNIKMENNELKKFVLKIACYYFDYISKIEYFDFDNTLLDKKS